MTNLMAAPPRPLVLPKIAYYSILPEIVLLGGAVAMLAASSLLRRPMDHATATTMTVMTALASLSLALVQWFQVQNNGPHTAIDGAVIQDGFSAFIAVLVSCAVLVAALVGRRVDARARSGRPRVPRPHAGLGVGGGDHGRGQRPHRDLPGPRDHVHRPVRAGGHERQAHRVGRGGAQVLHPRVVLLGRLPLRHRPRLRRHRARATSPRSPTTCRATSCCTTACCWRAWPCCWWDSCSRWRPCPSTCGRPTSTRGHRAR